MTATPPQNFTPVFRAGSVRAFRGCRQFFPRQRDHGDWVNRRYRYPVSNPVTFEVQRTISADHPSLPGHFPGAPIVPAVVIADEIATAVAEWRPDFEMVGINTLKFLAPLNPDQPFVISLSSENLTGDPVDVTCRVDNRVIVRGRLLLRRRPS